MDYDLELYNSISDQIHSLKQERKKILQEALFTEAAKLFDEHADLQSFRWTQFTPYWNDGEECEFDVNSVEWINGYYIWDLDDEEFEELAGLQDKYRARRLGEIATVFLREIGHDLLLKAFGDHVKVTVYRDRIETVGYVHD